MGVNESFPIYASLSPGLCACTVLCQRGRENERTEESARDSVRATERVHGRNGARAGERCERQSEGEIEWIRIAIVRFKCCLLFSQRKSRCLLTCYDFLCLPRARPHVLSYTGGVGLSHSHNRTTLHCTTSHCNTLQHTATRTLLHTATRCNTPPQHTATHCTAWQAALERAIGISEARDGTIKLDPAARQAEVPCVAVCCCVLLCVAVCCRVLPCVAVCCRVLPCVAV